MFIKFLIVAMFMMLTYQQGTLTREQLTSRINTFNVDVRSFLAGVTDLQSRLATLNGYADSINDKIRQYRQQESSSATYDQLKATYDEYQSRYSTYNTYRNNQVIPKRNELLTLKQTLSTQRTQLVRLISNF